MIGSKQYDANDDDWACEEDYVPKHRLCPSLIFTRSRTWQEVLEEMILLMKELMVEFCIAYSGILSKHTIVATGTTIAEAKRIYINKMNSIGNNVIFSDEVYGYTKEGVENSNILTLPQL